MIEKDMVIELETDSCRCTCTCIDTHAKTIVLASTLTRPRYPILPTLHCANDPLPTMPQLRPSFLKGSFIKMRIYSEPDSQSKTQIQ